MKSFHLTAAVLAGTLAIGAPAAVQASTVTGSASAEVGGLLTTALTATGGYEVRLQGGFEAVNNLSSLTDTAPAWLLEGSISGQYFNDDPQLPDGSFSESASTVLPGPSSANDLLGQLLALPVSMAFSVSQAIDVLIASSSCSGNTCSGSHIFGGGQNILPGGDIVAWTIANITLGANSISGSFDITASGDSAATSLPMFLTYLGGFGIDLGLDPAGPLAAVPDGVGFAASATLTPVPLPAALPLLGGGLALFGLMGWRKRRKAA